MGGTGRTTAKISYCASTTDRVPTTISKRCATNWKLESVLVTSTSTTTTRAEFPEFAGFSTSSGTTTTRSAAVAISEQSVATALKPLGWTADGSAAYHRFHLWTTVSPAATATAAASVATADRKPIPPYIAIAGLHSEQPLGTTNCTTITVASSPESQQSLWHVMVTTAAGTGSAVFHAAAASCAITSSNLWTAG